MNNVKRKRQLGLIFLMHCQEKTTSNFLKVCIVLYETIDIGELIENEKYHHHFDDIKY